ncbi:hypothetical protein C7999DRAFT_16653 [Corynascus novoguineensis]|uniref:Uncharacterized protein n=1 Tax=Corynascus novoguineensis TaxID=1126955 RepID=A0AAN7CN30_9PEZI|nr:hypothetical protein C7999DRAFT_16653 [Corynascus novoguineensis]
MATDKYPAYYDDTPKLPHDGSTTGAPSPGQQYSSPWGTGSENPVSALSPNGSVPWQSLPFDDQSTYVGTEPEREKRICGLRRRVFGIVVLVLGIIILAAAIGGGVGGAMASRNRSESDSSTSGTPTQSSTTSASPTSSFNPDPTLFQHFEFRAWSEPNFKGEASEVYREEGFYDLPFNLTSWVWATHKTDCCVSFCLDENTYGGGYRCDSTRRSKTAGGVGYSRVSLWCGDRNDEEMRMRCS